MTDHSPAGAARYLPPLTGIRALAALLVLALHTEQNVPTGLSAIAPFVGRGYLGVDFFFLLSGFIITYVYLGAVARPSRSAILVFLWHRFIRLYPVHVTVLAMLVAIVAAAHRAGFALNNPQDWQLSELPWHLAMLHAWGALPRPGWNAPSWSISAEWFAYLGFPFLAPVLLAVRDRLLALLLATIALAGTALLFAAADWSLNTWVGAPALARVSGEFVCGAALCRAVMLSKEAPPPDGDRLGTVAFLGFLLGASMGAPDFALVALLALTIVGAALARSYLASLLGCRIMIWLGEISYSIYMVHFPALLVVRRLWQRLGFPEWSLVGQVIAFLASIVLVIGLASLLFYAVERPARSRLRDQFGRLAPA